jgi:hypothetical protein
VNGQVRIDSIWAFTVVDDDNTEGVVGMTVPGLGFTPLVGADLARVASLRPYARSFATAIGKPVTLVHFSRRTEQEVLPP